MTLTDILRRDDLTFDREIAVELDTVDMPWRRGDYESPEVSLMATELDDVPVQALVEHECAEGCCVRYTPLSAGPVREWELRS